MHIYSRSVALNLIINYPFQSQNLISDVGGQLGLWLGLSAITIGEFIEFFVAIFKAATARAVKRRQQTTAVETLDLNVQSMLK